MAVQRRLYPRAMVRIPATLRVAGQDAEERVLLHDLSASGASIHTRNPLPVQRELHLRFALPSGGDAAIDVDCLVVRSAALTSPDRGFPFVAGLTFLDLQGARLQRVNEFVWSVMDADPSAG
jgi:c-di-GMP-binding flagellar brake protein YcgR